MLLKFVVHFPSSNVTIYINGSYKKISSNDLTGKNNRIKGATKSIVSVSKQQTMRTPSPG
jgi:hypothetical protein